MTDTSLDDLNKDFKEKVIQWLDQCEQDGLDVKITETWRDPHREDELHAEGITRATSKTCEHCDLDIDGNPASKAVDFACFRNHVYIRNGQDPIYVLAGQIAESLGIVWGGRFPHPDWDHIEMPNAAT